MADYSDGVWWSIDGLRLHYRSYAGPSGKPPILCLHGLTRNARDWEPVADRLAGDWQLYVLEMRGRGESAYASDPMTYVPLTYVQDVEAFLKDRNIDRYIAFGTSLGGIITMLQAATRPERLAGVTEAYAISRTSYRKTAQNLALAFAFNGIGIPLAATGLLHPIWAMIAMAASVTTVLLNSFGGRLLPNRDKKAGRR